MQTRRELLVSKGWMQAVALVGLCGFLLLGILAYRTFLTLGLAFWVILIFRGIRGRLGAESMDVLCALPGRRSLPPGASGAPFAKEGRGLPYLRIRLFS